MSWDNSRLSLTKVPHFVLFGVFFLFTAWQFARLDRRSLSWSLVATLALGLLVELEEGATRTGSCRLADLLPDLGGALIAMALLVPAILLRHRAMDRIPPA
jgi:VanZ family protein